jgi:hypothetical protein
MKNQKKHVANEATPETQTNENVNTTENQNNETAAQTETTPDSETPTPTPTAQTEHTPQQAETIEQLQQRLEIELERLNHKKRLAAHRQKFIDCMGDLQIYIDALQNENDFETKSGKITFKVLTADNYDRANFTDLFSISNTDLINKFCTMLYNEMENKKAELETELLKA